MNLRDDIKLHKNRLHLTNKQTFNTFKQKTVDLLIRVMHKICVLIISEHLFLNFML